MKRLFLLLALLVTVVAASAQEVRDDMTITPDDKKDSATYIITAQNFESLMEQGLPMVVDFYASWCSPCQKMMPIVESLAKEFEGRVIVGKCNVDNDDELPAWFYIRNVPTILFIKNGKIVYKQVGAVDEATVRAKIELLLK
jgi:thioredoxin 1